MSLYKIQQDIINKPFTLQNHFYEIYKKAYLSGIYSISDLISKLEKLESVEEQWKHHRNYDSYVASVEALRNIIEDILNNKLY